MRSSLAAAIPNRVHLPDDTLALLLQGYEFIGGRCRALGTDVFETRLLLQRTICMLGAEAARVFYDGERMQRAGAAPLRLQATLFGRGGVQALDGAAHHARKRRFVEVLAPEAVARLCAHVEDAWRAALPRWAGRVVLFDEVEGVLFRAACAWAGVEPDGERRVRDVVAMIEGSGAVGPRHWRGRVGRARAERWAARQIERARAGEQAATGALAAWAWSDLDARAAAVELLNVIRPIVAVARYIVFAAHALYDQPHTAELVEDDALIEPFVQEVRRYYPFFPAVAARVRRPFAWHGVDFAEGDRVLLDLYGTNHDPRIWRDPEVFRPERFVGWAGDPFTLIPQGGGDVATGHRCPGERTTIELTKTAVRLLTRAMTYDVPPQDLRVSLARIPAQPASRLVIEHARAV